MDRFRGTSARVPELQIEESQVLCSKLIGSTKPICRFLNYKNKKFTLRAAKRSVPRNQLTRSWNPTFRKSLFRVVKRSVPRNQLMGSWNCKINNQFSCNNTIGSCCPTSWCFSHSKEFRRFFAIICAAGLACKSVFLGLAFRTVRNYGPHCTCYLPFG